MLHLCCLLLSNMTARMQQAFIGAAIPDIKSEGHAEDDNDCAWSQAQQQADGQQGLNAPWKCQNALPKTRLQAAARILCADVVRGGADPPACSLGVVAWVHLRIKQNLFHNNEVYLVPARRIRSPAA